MCLATCPPLIHFLPRPSPPPSLRQAHHHPLPNHRLSPSTTTRSAPPPSSMIRRATAAASLAGSAPTTTTTNPTPTLRLPPNDRPHIHHHHNPYPRLPRIHHRHIPTLRKCLPPEESFARSGSNSLSPAAMARFGSNSLSPATAAVEVEVMICGGARSGSFSMAERAVYMAGYYSAVAGSGATAVATGTAVAELDGDSTECTRVFSEFVGVHTFFAGVNWSSSERISGVGSGRRCRLGWWMWSSGRREEATVHMCSSGGGGRRRCTCVHQVEEGGGRRRRCTCVHRVEEGGGGGAHVCWILTYLCFPKIPLAHVFAGFLNFELIKIP